MTLSWDMRRDPSHSLITLLIWNNFTNSTRTNPTRFGRFEDSFGPSSTGLFTGHFYVLVDAAASCFSFGSNVWCGLKGSRSFWMNISKGIQDTKWSLCPLHKAVSHAPTSPILVSHKRYARSQRWWGGWRTAKGPVCRRELADGGSEAEMEAQVWRKKGQSEECGQKLSSECWSVLEVMTTM